MLWPVWIKGGYHNQTDYLRHAGGKDANVGKESDHHTCVPRESTYRTTWRIVNVESDLDELVPWK